MARVRGAATEVQQIFLKVISVLNEVVCISKWCHCVRRTIAVPKKNIITQFYCKHISKWRNCKRQAITEQLRRQQLWKMRNCRVISAIVEDEQLQSN